MEEKEIGEKLLYIRKEACLSQKEAANQLGISRQTLSKWETGKSYPDAMFVKKISEIYKISIDELLDSHYSPKNDKRNTNPPKRYRKIWFLLGIADFLLCFILISRSSYMIFWTLNFNIILLTTILLRYLFFFFKVKMKDTSI